MLMVNNPGSWSAVYAPFSHADWHGLTSTDLVFLFFLFGLGLIWSLCSLLIKPYERQASLAHIRGYIYCFVLPYCSTALQKTDIY